MEPTVHFYDAQHIGSPASGQLVSFDSLVCTTAGLSRYATQIRLRPDVSFNPEAVEQLDCFDLNLEDGITEYEWSQQVQDVFATPNTLHIGMGNTSTIDHFIRFAMYRCLSTLPNTELPPGAHYLDLLTVCQAISILRPESVPIVMPAHWAMQRKRDLVFRTLGGSTRAESLLGLTRAISDANPKLLAHAISHSSPGRISELCGLVDGHVESLSTLRPVFICHEQLTAATQFGAYMVLGTDPQYRNIVYMIDLQCDITELIESCGASVARFIRSDASQMDRPVVRVNLNRVPFVSPLGVVDQATASRLGWDITSIKARVAQLREHADLSLALMEISGASEAGLNGDPDHQLFGAEYLSPDKALLQKMHTVGLNEWEPLVGLAHDARIRSLGSRLIRRCAPALLAEDEQKEWRTHCASRLLGRANSSRIAAMREYCTTIAGSSVYPQGIRSAARHWLYTTEVGHESSIHV